MSNSVPTLTPHSILGMTGKVERPVYFLTLAGSAVPNLVVKGEAGTNNHPGMSDAEATISVKWSSKLMKNVNNPLVNTKIMTAPEIVEFQRAAAALLTAGSPQRVNSTNPGGMYTWVKMPLVPGLSDAEYYDAANAVVPGNIKVNILKFSDDMVWAELGKVVAVDLFNGNNDRFTVDGHWQNKGNVMFLTGGATAVIGLDTFDPNAGAMANLATGGRFDELRILIDLARRDAFALACTGSVGNEMKRAFKTTAEVTLKGKTTFGLITQAPGGAQVVRHIKIDEMEQLFLPYAPTFAQGISTGAAQLKAYLQAKVRQYRPAPVWQRAAPAGAAVAPAPGWQRAVPGGARAVAPAPAPGAAAAPVKVVPQGILDRMAFLGWQV